MFGRKPPDPILVKSLEKALAASRADVGFNVAQLGKRAGEAIVLREKIERLEDELAMEKSCGALVDSELRVALAELRRRCEASELLARKIGEARDQLADELAHAQHQVKSLLTAADTHYNAAVDISHEPLPADDTEGGEPEAKPLMQCKGWPQCGVKCFYRHPHEADDLCEMECTKGGCTCEPIPATPDPPAPDPVICDLSWCPKART